MALNATLVADGRTGERQRTELRATARGDDGRPDDVTVYDLSLSGFRISPVPGVAVGDALTLGLSGVGTRRAVVIRDAGDALGCAFEQPLSYRELRDSLTGDTVVPVNFAPPRPAEPEEAPPRAWSVLPVVLVAAVAWLLGGLFLLGLLFGVI